MLNKPLALSFALATALACSPLAFAATAPAAGTSAQTTRMHSMHKGMHQGMRGGHHGMGILRQLDLTDAQRTSVHQLMQQNFEQARPKMEAVRSKRQAFENTTPGSANYQATANDLAQAEATAIHARVLREATLRSKIYGLLTPAQRTKLASIRTQREARMQQRREAWTQHHAAPAASAPATSSN